MSATQRKAGRAKVRPKLIEVDGHLLTPEIHRRFAAALQARQHTNRGISYEQLERLALDDVLAEHRFSRMARARLLSLFQDLTGVATAIASLHDYPYHEEGAVRLTACDALSRLAAEAQAIGAKVHAIGEAIRYEHTEKLQDWQARARVLGVMR